MIALLALSLLSVAYVLVVLLLILTINVLNNFLYALRCFYMGHENYCFRGVR
jgi:hypothetical protein